MVPIVINVLFIYLAQQSVHAWLSIRAYIVLLT